MEKIVQERFDVAFASDGLVHAVISRYTSRGAGMMDHTPVPHLEQASYSEIQPLFGTSHAPKL